MNKPETKMNCNLVLHEAFRGWVIEKMARRLADEIAGLGHNVEIAERPSSAADINHLMMFYHLPEVLPARCTVAITHIDDSVRLGQARAAVEKAEVAVCMSSMTVKQLVNDGMPRDKLCYVLPAFDRGIEPRRLVVGLTTKLYSDGRKREALLVRMADETDLSPFHFDIYGTGWDEVAGKLRQAGAKVSVTTDGTNSMSAYELIRSRIPHFDYYLYLGLDEGSLGTLDALAAGVKTIVTPQGFHVDLPHGITHPFWSYDELRNVFQNILDDRNKRVRAVSELTWRKYAERHLIIWEAVRDGRVSDLPRLLEQESLAPLGGYDKNMEEHMEQERRALRGRTLVRHTLPAIRRYCSSRIRRWMPEPVLRMLKRQKMDGNG